MRRGTTPTHTFTLPVDAGEIVKVRVNYAQNRKLVLVKTETDAEVLEGRTLQYRLSQQETLSFSSNADVEIQMDILTRAGEALKSEISRVPAHRCLNEEVLE